MPALSLFSYAGAEVGPLVRLTRGLESGRVVWWLAEEVRYVAHTRSGDLAFDLPVGAATDGCSTPAGLRWLVPPVSFRTFLPAALHDSLWSGRQAQRAAGLAPSYRRELIDWIFREALLGEGVAPAVAWALWAAVRLQAWWTGDRDPRLSSPPA